MYLADTAFHLYMKEPGYYNNSLPLLDLRWESLTTFDTGLDVGFFKNRVLIEADVYVREVKDKISGYPLPYYTGFTSLNTNIGTLQNKGFEITVNANIVDQPQGLKWDVGLTAFTNTSYVKKLPDNGLPKNRQGGTQIYDPSSKKVIWVVAFRKENGSAMILYWDIFRKACTKPMKR